MTVLTREEVKRLEQQYVSADESNEFIQLMENAGDKIARFVFDKTGIEGKAISVVCGRGNNGGDGFVAARKFYENGARVCIIIADGAPATNDAIDVLSRAERAGVHIIKEINDENRGDVERFIMEADIVVDALFGIGFHGEMPEHLEKIVELMNITEATIISADIPSGVSSDTGEVAACCVRANYTIAFTALKPGHIIYPGVERCGQIITVPVGIEQSMVDTFQSMVTTIDYQNVRLCFQPRRANTHKGTYGSLSIVCGSLGMAGAAIFAARAAVQSGVGLVRAVLPRSIYPIVASQAVDPVYTPMDENADGTLRAEDCDRIMEIISRTNACLIGCGLGINDDTRAIVRRILADFAGTVVLDADALTIVSEDIKMLRDTHAKVILTPHPGEMARLSGAEIVDIQSRRLTAALELSQELGVTTILKGANTVIAHTDGSLQINLTGNPGMAKGGSGDVLAGIVASLAAQGMSNADAAACGVYIHGAAGDRAAAKYSQHSMTPTDIIFDLPSVFLDIER